MSQENRREFLIGVAGLSIAVGKIITFDSFKSSFNLKDFPAGITVADLNEMYEKMQLGECRPALIIIPTNLADELGIEYEKEAENAIQTRDISLPTNN